jgi:hypothetical protein
MNKPSSTIQSAGLAGFIASSLLLVVKIAWPDIYVEIPAEYQGYLVTAIMVGFGYFKKENVLPVAK